MHLRSTFVALLFAGAVTPVFPATIYVQNNLVSDLPGVAATTDSALVNPWGLSSSATSPWWVSDNGTGLSTLYNGNGVKQGLVVTIPAPPGDTSPAAPTGQLFNSTAADFKVGATKSNFIFATEDGTIAAWASGTSAALEVDNSGSGAVYKGIALGNNGTGNLLYAANFNSGKIDVFNASFGATTVPGGFVDPTLPAGYAPFNIENIGGSLYVTYALQDADKHDDVAGAGHGFIDVFDTNGNLQRRLVSGGSLDSPWGMALAPSNFGSFSGDLLVGNFGDGTIDAYTLTGSLVGELSGTSGNPLVIQGLWGLAFGNGANAGATNALYFTAGIPGPDSIEDHGLFGDIVVAPEPGTVFLLVGALMALLITAHRRRASDR